MQTHPPTQATRAAVAAATESDAPSRHADVERGNNTSTSANESQQHEEEEQTSASNELISEEAGRSLAFETDANRTSNLLKNPKFDDTTLNDEEYEEDESAAAAGTSASPDENENEQEPGLRRRVSLMASLVPDNKRLAALLAGKGPISSELKKLAKSSGLSKALVERARRRQRASARPSAKAGAQKQSSQKKRATTTGQTTAKSMQTRQGLATTTMASSSQLDASQQASHLLNAVNLSHLARNNHLKQQQQQQLSGAMSASGGTLPQLSSAIQRLISLGKFGIAGGGGPASTQQQQQQMLLAHLNDKRNNQTTALLSNNGNNGGHHQTTKQSSYHGDHGDFSLTSASDGADGSSSPGAGRFHSHSATDDFDSELPFELASGSAEQQVPHSEHLDEADELGNQQQPASSARLAELMVGRWRAQMAAGGGPSEVASATTTTTHDGGLLSLQAAQQRNKLASAGHSLLDLPATSGGGGGDASATSKQQLIPVEIIGLDPSVTNSILYGSAHQQQQQQQARRAPPMQQLLQPLLSATSQQDHYQQMSAHAAPPGGDHAHHQQLQQPNGDQAASELDIHAPPSHDNYYSNVRGQNVLDSDAGGQDSNHADHNRPPIAGPKQSPVLHVHHFHHTTPSEPAAINQQEKTEVVAGVQQQDSGQQDSAGQQQVVSGTASVGEIGAVATAGESENVEEPQQAPAEDARGEQSPVSDARGQSKGAKMRFVSSASLKGRQQQQQQQQRPPQAQTYTPVADGRPPRLARPPASLYSGTESDEEQEPPNYDQSQSETGPNNNNLLMVSYKPAGPAHQLSYQQQQQQQLYPDRYAEPSYQADGGFNPSFQRPPPPYNEGSESKYPSLAGGSRVSAPSNLLQSYQHVNNTAANLLRSLMLRQQQQQQRFQIKLAGPNEAGQWSSEDERLLNQFNLANNNNNNDHQHYPRLPLMMASSGAGGGLAANLTASRQTQNPFQSNNYQQFLLDNLAMLNQLKAAQHRPQANQHLGPARSVSLSPTDNLATGVVANITSDFPLANTTTTTTNSRYELASASDRFASKLRATNTTGARFTAINDNFYVPNTRTSNKSSLDLLPQTKPPVVQTLGQDSAATHVDQSQRQVQAKTPLPSSVHTTTSAGDVTNFMDSTNGLSNLALAFIFVVSLLTFILIAASLIYRRRRGRVRYGGASLASGRAGAGGSHLTGGPAHYKSTATTIGGGARLNLGRAKHMMRSSFAGANRGGHNENTNTDTTDSLKSIGRQLGEGVAASKSHPPSGNALQTQNGQTTVQQRQLKSVLKQPGQQKQQDPNNNYINKYICANQQQSGTSKASRFFNFGFASSGGDKYQSADESTTAQDQDNATLTSNPDSDIKTLNTRARANYLHGQHQQASSKHPTSHKRVVANHTIQRGGGGGGAKYKNLPPIGQQGPLAPPSEACLKHAML